MMLGGVFERFPRLKFVLSEQGCAWVPSTLAQLDGLHMAASFGRTGELKLDAGALPLKPSEYFERNVWIGASFPQLRDTGAMRKIGLHKVMWGSDYPHHEGVSPYTREHLRRSFHDWSTEELDQVLTTTAAEVYGFDVDALVASGPRGGPDRGRGRRAPRPHPRRARPAPRSTCDRLPLSPGLPSTGPSPSSPRRAAARASTACASCARCTTTRGSTSTRCASGTAPSWPRRSTRSAPPCWCARPTSCAARCSTGPCG